MHDVVRQSLCYFTKRIRGHFDDLQNYAIDLGIPDVYISSPECCSNASNLDERARGVYVSVTRTAAVAC